MSEADIPTRTVAETEHNMIWVSEEPDGETVYHIDLGPVTLHFFREEWEEFKQLFQQLEQR